MFDTALSCAGLGLTYPDHGKSVHALSDVGFEARRGEFVSVIGPSGCGKTTLLHVLAGLLRPSTGTVELADQEPGQPPSAALVFQENSLFPWMTVLENAAFGLGGRERDYPRQLSTGMKQRVAVIRAFLSGAPVLVRTW